MNKATRDEKNRHMASEMKRMKIERSPGRCPICNRVIHADYLKGGMATHRCERD